MECLKFIRDEDDEDNGKEEERGWRCEEDEGIKLKKGKRKKTKKRGKIRKIESQR